MNKHLGIGIMFILTVTIAGLSLANITIISAAKAIDNNLRLAGDSQQKAWRLDQSDPTLARRGMQAAFDSQRQVVVMFGGFDNQDIVDNETWEFNGTSWQQVTPVHSPSARYGHGMVYDDDRHVVVLFGGNDGQGNGLNDTWEYNGTDWIQVTTLHAPSHRQHFGMTYDSCRQKAVLFGGGETSTGTWEYNGTDWQEIVVTTNPGGLYMTAMTFDTTRCRVVLFGGDGGAAKGTNDTWEYDGLNWTDINTATSPLSRWGHAIAFDPVHERTILFGGYGPEYPTGTPLGDTWEYDGTNWIETSPSVSPSANEQHILVYEGTHEKILLFGGFGSGETWFYGNEYSVYLPLVVRP